MDNDENNMESFYYYLVRAKLVQSWCKFEKCSANVERANDESSQFLVYMDFVIRAILRFLRLFGGYDFGSVVHLLAFVARNGLVAGIDLHDGQRAEARRWRHIRFRSGARPRFYSVFLQRYPRT